MSAASGTIPVANETNATASRLTKDGRRITYRMSVIQQPERARACGSGAKSSADRRPVDPPPIVELKVFEGSNAETDITFSYKANFFLFATLETARVLAQGRGLPSSQPTFPVLTGTPVAGMAYLDRPEPAGYFIFPDLSVRHEGKYRLAFSLYEELKERGDMDTETSDNAEQRSAHVSHRLEVKSTPFTVFSAKKFPGLTESTQLSRIVAEQGCRVRIRRDVRMRRRGGDGKRDYDDDDFDQPAAYDRNRASATPDQPAYAMGTPQIPGDDVNRPRSASNTSAASYIPQSNRRPSGEQIAQTYQQSYAGSPVTPHTPQGMYPPQGPPPTQQWHNQPPQHASYMQPPPASAYPPQQQSYQVPQPQPMAPPNYGYMPPSMSPQYPPYDNGQPRHNSLDYSQPLNGPQRTSTSQQPAQHSPQQAQQPHYSPHSMPQYKPSYSHPPPHSSPMAPSEPAMQPPPISSAPSYAATQPPPAPQYAPPPVPAAQPPHSQGEYYDPTRSNVVPPKFAHAPQPSGATKRTYSSTFNAEALEQPLRQGARPAVTAEDPRAPPPFGRDGPEDDMLDDSAMSYRRADGTERRRRIPIVA